MLALVKYAEGKGNLELRDVPVPEVGEADVLIEVKAAGICGSDIGFADEERMSILRPPVVLGHEFAGVVAGGRLEGEGLEAGRPRRVRQHGVRLRDLLCLLRRGLPAVPGATGAGLRHGRRLHEVRPHRRRAAGPRAQHAVPHPRRRPLRARRAPRPRGQCLPCRGAGGRAPAGRDGRRLRGGGARPVLHPDGPYRRGGRRSSPSGSRPTPSGSRRPAPSARPDASPRTGRMRPPSSGSSQAARGSGLVIDAAGPSAVLQQSFSILRNTGTFVKIGYDPKVTGVLAQSPSGQGHPGQRAFRLRLGLLEELHPPAGQGSATDRSPHHPHAAAEQVAGGFRAHAVEEGGEGGARARVGKGLHLRASPRTVTVEPHAVFVLMTR